MVTRLFCWRNKDLLEMALTGLGLHMAVVNLGINGGGYFVVSTMRLMAHMASAKTTIDPHHEIMNVPT